MYRLMLAFFDFFYKTSGELGQNKGSMTNNIPQGVNMLTLNSTDATIPL